MLVCPFSREVWFQVLRWLGQERVLQQVQSDFFLGLVVSCTKVDSETLATWLSLFSCSHLLDPVEGKERQNLRSPCSNGPGSRGPGLR
jgi:hypothetical protein